MISYIDVYDKLLIAADGNLSENHNQSKCSLLALVPVDTSTKQILRLKEHCRKGRTIVKRRGSWSLL